MKRKFIALILVLTLLSTLPAPIAFAHNAPFPGGYDPTHFVIDTFGDPESMDPAWAYDTVSGEVIFNVYETLLFFDVVYEDGPYKAGKTDVFVPQLATALPIIDYSSSEINPMTGLPYYSTWYFPIRSGVQFHNGWGTLIPADVEYSFEREMIQDRSGGPQWMLFEPLLEKYFADLTTANGGAIGTEIDAAVESNSTHVWFNLVAAYPELAFKQILGQSWASVVSKVWAVSRGDFDGNWARPWEDIFNMWHNPEVSFLDSPEPEMVGTGPYMFSYWNSGMGYSLVRNPYYWKGWPGALPPERYYPPYLGGYIERVTWREYGSWTVRRSNFLSGTSDETVVPRSYRDQVLGHIVGGEKIRCYYPIPSLSLNAFFFTLDIRPSDGYRIQVVLPRHFDPGRIPSDTFTDVNVRKGFAYAFDYNMYLAQAYLGEGEQPADPVSEGIAYDNPNNNKHSYNMTKAEYYLKLAWDGVDTRSGTPNVPVLPEDPDQVTPGLLWNGGMGFSVLFDIGNSERELFASIIATNINSLNPTKFFLTPLGVVWGTQYLPAMVANQLPLFLMEWSADYADPQDSVFPFQYSFGPFPQWQRYSNPVVDALIKAGIATPDGTTPYTSVLDVGEPIPLMDNVGLGKTYDSDWRNWPTDPDAYLSGEGGTPLDSRWPRRSIYYALQQIYVEETASVPLVQPTGRHFEQAWMRGWYYNPLYPGEYVYHRWKAKTHYGDVSGSIYGIADGRVDVYDAAFVSAHWSNPQGVYGYHPTADINGGIGATTAGFTGTVRGIPDGKVDLPDIGLVRAYWDNPEGPSHP